MRERGRGGEGETEGEGEGEHRGVSEVDRQTKEDVANSLEFLLFSSKLT